MVVRVWGNDWAYMGCFPNSNTGLTPSEAQGLGFVLVNPPATSGNDIRITGYGTDGSPASANQTQQTHAGPFVNNAGTQVGYVTDTTGGNSGSPVIWEQAGTAIGIHTHGGCSSTGGNNWGTSTLNSGLQGALANPLGVCSCDGGGGPQVLFSDGFESGGFSAGNWSTQNSNARVRSNAKRTGAYGAQLKRTTWIERSLSTAGFENVTLNYSRRTRGYESNEFLFIEYWDGSSWNLVEQTRSTSWGDMSMALPASADNNGSFRVRFRTNANKPNEKADVDDVEVIGDSLP